MRNALLIAAVIFIGGAAPGWCQLDDCNFLCPGQSATNCSHIHDAHLDLGDCRNWSVEVQYPALGIGHCVVNLDTSDGKVKSWDADMEVGLTSASISGSFTCGTVGSGRVRHSYTMTCNTGNGGRIAAQAGAFGGLCSRVDQGYAFSYCACNASGNGASCGICSGPGVCTSNPI